MRDTQWIAVVVAALTAMGGCGGSGKTRASTTQHATATATATPTATKLSPEQQVRAVAYKLTTAVSNGDADKACALMRKTGDRACQTLFYRDKPQQYVAPVIGVQIQGRKATAKLPWAASSGCVATMTRSRGTSSTRGCPGEPTRSHDATVVRGLVVLPAHAADGRRASLHGCPSATAAADTELESRTPSLRVELSQGQLELFSPESRRQAEPSPDRSDQ